MRLNQMELTKKLTKKKNIFLALIAVSFWFMFYALIQDRSYETVAGDVISTSNALRVTQDVPKTHLSVIGTLKNVSINEVEEWNPYEDILDEAEVLKDVPLTDIKNSINITLTRMYLIGPSQYQVGDEVRVGILSVDGYNKVRTRGGDQFRVRIFEKEKGAGAAGYMIDHKNGTYTAVVRALWSGSPKIEIHSAYPREAVRSWYYTLNQIPTTRVYYAHYQYENTTVTGPCHPFLDIVWNGTFGFCNMTSQNAGMSLYCLKPDQVTCTDFLQWTITYDKETTTRTEAEAILLKRNMEYLLPNIQINVTGPPTISTDQLPKCAEYSKRDLWFQNSPVGFFYNGTWNTVHCKPPTTESINKCLRGKHITLVGDSTVRQWLFHIFTVYNCVVLVDDPEYKLYHSTTHNFTLQFEFHSVPGFYFKKGTPHSIPGIMANSTFTDSHIFMFHMHVHVSAYHPNVFRDRMVNIRNAIVKILQTNPHARFFVKGPSTFREQGQYGDYFGYVYRVIMLEVFEGLYDKITYLDIKDITIASRQTFCHPDLPTTGVMVDQLLYYVCN